MTPEEKAKELVDKYRGTLKYGQRQWGQVHYAKQCALIAVGEIMGLPVVWYDKSISEEDGDTIEYWEQVKQAIQSL